MSVANSRSNVKDSKVRTKKDQPQCSHCGVLKHIVDEFFKFYELPPNINQKGKSGFVAIINHIYVEAFKHAIDKSKIVLSTHQYQNLLSMLQSQLSHAIKPMANVNKSKFGGKVFSTSFQSTYFSSKMWLVDSGATRHIYSNLQMFQSHSLTLNTYVTFPKIPIYLFILLELFIFLLV